MNRTNQIGWNSPDLVSSNETRYVKLDNDWWRESRQFSYHRDDSAEPQLMSTVRTRLTGLGSIPAGKHHAYP